MKKVISILLICIIAISLFADSIPLQEPDSILLLKTDSIIPFQEDDLERGMIEGEKYANKQSEIKWGFIGFASGFLLPPLGIGCLGVTLAGYSISPSIPKTVANENSKFIMGFQNTYTPKIRIKRALASFIGGTIGTLSMSILLATLNNTVWN